ncbi:GMC oxidoreductase [Epithele typhae]|uniref:GMC oxidoreductase n=1 Tax=Epithele typhae TaxID=378194 RepID=UPI0020073563|nr:GMC oxidoreductase [Epithele typhae]KAH9920536.1 GMC oxidoreductase [Epithele typhae]
MESLLTTIDNVSGQVFDYVIIGGGTAGLVLAARLSEEPSKTVLVLEAGGAHLNDPLIDLPAGYGKFMGNPEYDWAFTTVPQKHSKDTSFFWPRGKGLGGSSAVNFYTWSRAEKEDINAWERLGNPGWNWENHLKYAIKSETFVPASAEVAEKERQTHDPAVHGTDGPIVIGFPNTTSGWEVAMQDSLEALGFPRLRDLQTGTLVGAGRVPSTVDPRANTRTTSQDYLKLAVGRSNLKILVNASVARVLLGPTEDGGFVASGVEFLFDGKTHVVSTSPSGEVILSAGTLKSPQILELSGIGDPAILEKIGVETKVSLPAVGTNVQEHLFAGMAYEVNEPEKYNTIDELTDPAKVAEHMALYPDGKGLFTLGISLLSWTSLKDISARAADIEATAPTTSTTPGLTEQYAEQHARIAEGAASAEYTTIPGFYSFPNPPTPGAKHVTLCSMLNRPFSRGTIHATSADPLAPPAIDPHYFEEPADLAAYVEQIKFARRLARTAPFAAVLGKELNPGPAVASDAELARWLKKHMTTVHHTAGACAMLPRDRGGVVDPQLRVYGTTGLRVVDLSVVPLIPGAHTQSVVYAVAEQAADVIKGVFVA